jgi:hypothetical protein
VAALLGTSGCDVGQPREEPPEGPALRIVGTFPEDGAGLDCTPEGPADCGVPRDAPVEIRFDRFLLPSTASRQSLSVLTRVPDLAVFLEPQYDIVERVVSFYPYSGLWEAGALHTVSIPIPTDEFPDGFRAFDGAAIDGNGVPSIRFSFRVARETPEPPPERVPVTCAEVLAVFGRSGCSSAQCHGGDPPTAGLRLDTGEGLAETAIGRVARETETGVEVDRPLVDPPVFGRQMPIIDPGAPSNSYLVYKLLAKRENFATPGNDCETVHRPPVNDACLTPSKAEVERLRDGFVRLQAMPAPPGALRSVDDLRRIVAYIEDGASLSDCD